MTDVLFDAPTAASPVVGDGALPNPQGEGGKGSAPVVIGVDLSLRATGVAAEHGVDTIGTEPHGDSVYCRAERIRGIRRRVLAWTTSADLVVIEGPAFSRNESGVFDRSWLWGSLVEVLIRRGVPVAVVGPSNLKKYACGKGNASKETVLLAAARRFPAVEISNNNEADAQWLLAMGLDHLGRPLVLMPDLNRSTLPQCQWPQLVSA